jgi:hypothetical protein
MPMLSGLQGIGCADYRQMVFPIGLSLAYGKLFKTLDSSRED